MVIIVILARANSISLAPLCLRRPQNAITLPKLERALLESLSVITRPMADRSDRGGSGREAAHPPPCNTRGRCVLIADQCRQPSVRHAAKPSSSVPIRIELPSAECVWATPIVLEVGQVAAAHLSFSGQGVWVGYSRKSL